MRLSHAEDKKNADRRRELKNLATRILPSWIYKIVKPFFVSGGRDEQWLRVVMNRETKQLVAALGPENLDAFEISGNDWKSLFPFKSHAEAFYPAFDICTGTNGKQYDLIIAEQVFEHLLQPYRAGKNVFEMLRPGGYFLITTPFLLRIHSYPVDCTRWSPLGMKHFLAECGFPIEHIEVSAWGNRSCVKANFNRWQIYQPWRHSLENEPDFPGVVWALARKA